MESAPEKQLDLPTDLPKEIPASIEVTREKSHSEEHHSEEHTDSSFPKTLLAWFAPGRPFRKKGRQFFATAILITLLILVILFLFSQYLLMLVVLSLLFLGFSLSLVPPRDFHYRISSEGITIEDHSYLWQELYDFYFKRRDGVDVLMIRTHAFFPGELSITLGAMDKNHVRQIMLPYLPYREMVMKSFMEKSADWLVHNFPLERPVTQ